MSSFLVSTFNFASNYFQDTYSRISELFLREEEKDKREYYGLIEQFNGTLCISVIDVETETEICEKLFFVIERYDSIKDFINDLPNVFNKNFRAVILSIFDIPCPQYSSNYEICKAFKDFFDSAKIPSYFISEHDWILFCMLVAAKLDTVKINDKILFVFVSNAEYDVYGYQFKGNGFRRIFHRAVSGDQKSESVRREIVGSDNPVKIIATPKNDAEKPWRTGLRKIKFKLDGFIFVSPDDEVYATEQAIVALSRWILDNTVNTDYFILPSSERRYFIMSWCNGKTSVVQSVGVNESLPFEGNSLVQRSKEQYFMCYKCEKTDESKILAKITVPKNAHQSRLFFSIDINNIPSCQVKSFTYPVVKNLPATLTECLKSKIPVIGVCENFSVICVNKSDKNEYQFVDKWNGMYGEELFVSFHNEKLKYGQAAADDYLKYPSSVVFDLLQIISQPVDRIQIQPSWGFKITQNSENPILLQFDNFDGTKKAAPPVFLLALLLKEHLKVIKAEIGERPKELGFWFYNKFNAGENQRIKNGFKDACELIKIGFVEVNF